MGFQLTLQLTNMVQEAYHWLLRTVVFQPTQNSILEEQLPLSFGIIPMDTLGADMFAIFLQ
jgi:hypothetical protein